MSGTSGRHIVLGMAGHIDHGKTAIVKALTGVDTDRLKEEKERGMTTDLGFAFLGDDITIIDVPGHEKFIKTMVAGVNTVDFALLVIAADDGVMPQTREHLEILRLLEIGKGLVALNKIDLVEPDWLEMVKGDIRELLKGTFLDGAPIIPVNALSGQGISELKREISEIAQSVSERRDKGIFRLPIDRVFTIKGFGTVVAGTVLSGTIKVEEPVELLPQGQVLRVRGLQVHERSVPESRVGFRTAINLMGIEKEAIERGDTLAAPGFFKPTHMVDARFSYLSSASSNLENRSRIRVHLGTSEVIARIVLLDRELLRPGEEGLVQIHFEKPVVADAGDRFVVRTYSPLQTIGGGSILDPHPVKHKRFQEEVQQRLRQIAEGDPQQQVLEQLMKLDSSLVSVNELSRAASLPTDVCLQHLQSLEKENQAICYHQVYWYASANLVMLRNRVKEVLDRFHRDHPLRTGMPLSELHSRIKPAIDKRLFDALCDTLGREGVVSVVSDRASRADFRVQLSSDQIRLKENIERRFLAAPLMPPGVEDVLVGTGKEGEQILQLMIDGGELVRLEEGIVIHRNAIEQAKRSVTELFAKQRQATLSEIRQHLGITRKYAVPLLVYLDSVGFTERDGDVRLLKQPRL